MLSIRSYGSVRFQVRFCAFVWTADRLGVDFSRILLYHEPSVAFGAVYLLESQSLHHGDVYKRQDSK